MGIIFPEPNSTATFIDNLRYLDSLTDIGYGGALGIGLMLIIFGVVFLVTKSTKNEHSFVVASFITAFLGVLIRIMLLVNDSILFISIILFVVSFIMLKAGKKGE